MFALRGDCGSWGGGGGERVLNCSIHDFHTVSPSICHILVMVNTGASFLHTVVVTSSCETESAGVAGAAAGPSAGLGERPGAVRRPWRATWGRPPAVESDLGPSAGRGERPGAFRRPRRATWGRPPAAESDLGPSASRGERPGAVRRLWRGYQCCSCVNGINTMNF